MFTRLLLVPVCAVCVFVNPAGAQGRQGGAAPALSATPKTGETFLWHGELVSVDGATRTLTVRARVLRDGAAEVERLKAGERVLVTWSGADIHGVAVRRVTRHDPAQRIADFFALPAELGSPDVQGGLMTLRIRIPDASVAAVKGLKPGEWVSVTARQRPADEGEAIVAVGAYAKPTPVVN